MDNAFFDFVHPRHFDAFVEAAHHFGCHILVRETGRATLAWVGRSGYAGKRADMKAKTAARDTGGYQLAGLVVSPEIHPGACKEGAAGEWQKVRHLVTVPPAGFSDDQQPIGCRTPYLLQTNPRHRHYGCVAWVENGLLTPRYVHGDYDLYAIVPAGQPYAPPGSHTAGLPMHSTMSLPRQLTLAQRVQIQSAADRDPQRDHVGPLSLQVATFVNLKIAHTMPGLASALMVNHGEQVNLGADRHDFQKVLAFLASPQQGSVARILHDRTEHEAFYRNA